MTPITRYYACCERLDDARLSGGEHRIHRLTAWVEHLKREAAWALAEERREMDQQVENLFETFARIFGNH